jgi:PAS domain S-box-containing protein
MEQPSHVSLAAGGEMGDMIRAHDWAQSPLGLLEQWPVVLTSTLNICLGSRFPMAVYWGEAGLLLYNDAWRPILGRKHPWAIGRPAREVWPEIWDAIAPLFDSVRLTGEATWRGDELLAMQRFGYTEECYFDYTFNPIRGAGGQVEGILNVVQETTYRVLNDRRQRLLRELAAHSGSGKSESDAWNMAMAALASDPADIPFALLYLLQPGGQKASLAAGIGLHDESAARVQEIDLAAGDRYAWPLAPVFRESRSLALDDVAARFGALPGGIWPEPTTQALVLPVAIAGQQGPTAALVLGVNPRHRLDEVYSHFFDLVASQIAAAVTNAGAYAFEKRRAEALAELDRAKTDFFSNVSHEFRTPLTLMLGPVEDLLTAPHTDIAPRVKEQLQMINRNGLRLLRLVNTLLDFSRIEAGRVQASFEPTDLARFTAEIAGMFRSVAERAGLRLVVDCPSLPEPVYVDRDMWEKIVLNLVSNAFKFTFAGEIAVTLRPDREEGRYVTLSVRDTGIGMTSDDLSRIFDRFHRVVGARARTYEGTGIGLALVQELVKQHGGAVEVESVVDEGSTFSVRVPLGAAHLPAALVGQGSPPAVPTPEATPFVEEALRWQAGDRSEEGGLRTEASHGMSTPSIACEPDIAPRDHLSSQQRSILGARAPRPRVLVVDDNADMRDYVVRLLADRYDVDAAPDGEAALVSARARPPDLVLTDVMMPQQDGLELLRRLRAEPGTKTIPIILLSARAGEGSRVEGLERGADDYLTKPFSAKELLARIASHLDLSHLRREAEREIARGRRFLERIAASTPDIVFVFDLIARRTVYLNRSLETMLGYSVEQLDSMSGDPIDVLLHPDDAQGVQDWYAGFERAVDDQITEHEHRVRHVDGSYRWILVRATVFDRTADGRVGQIMGLATDITGRKQADELNARLAAIVESSDDAIVGKDLSGIITSWNEGAERLFGYTAHEIIGRPITMLMPPERVHEEAGILDRIRRGDRVRHYETMRRRKDGTLVDVSLTVSPVRNSSGTIVGASKIARNITGRKRQETELLTRSRQQRLLYELANAVNRAEALPDLYEKALDTIIGSLNADRASILLFDDDDVMRFKAWRGLSEGYRRAVEGHSPWQRDTANPVPIVMGNIAEAGLSPELGDVIRRERIQALSFVPLTYGSRLLGKFMMYFNRPYTMDEEEVSLALAIAGTLALGIERKRAEEALRRSEQQLRFITDHAPIFIVQCDAEGRYTFVNAPYAERFGLRAEQLIGKLIPDVLGPQAYETLRRHVEAALRGERVEFEEKVPYAGLGPLWMHCVYVPQRTPAGQPAGFVAVVQDVTKRRHMEEALRQGEERLRKFALELEQLVEERTRDLVRSQNRLRALATELNLTEQRQRGRLATELHDYLGQLLALGKIKVSQAARRPLDEPTAKLVTDLKEIMDQSLTYTRTLVAELSPPVLNEFGLPIALRWLADHMRQRDLSVSLDLDTDALVLPEDQAVLVFQSVRELLMNVLKHSETKEAFLTMRGSAGTLSITITDQGVGFDAAADKAGGGSGFGLFSIRERMFALGGHFHIVSAPGQGTTATLRLPLAKPETLSAESVMPNSEPAVFEAPVALTFKAGYAGLPSRSSLHQPAKVRVLLVDDHAMVRQGLRGLLAAYGDIDVVGEAANGEEAVALAARLQPDVVLMDVNMPKMDGIEATRRITQANGGAVIVGLSVQNHSHVERAMREAGAVAFVNKEAAVEELYRSIRAALMKGAAPTGDWPR